MKKSHFQGIVVHKYLKSFKFCSNIEKMMLSYLAKKYRIDVYELDNHLTYDENKEIIKQKVLIF